MANSFQSTPFSGFSVWGNYHLKFTHESKNLLAPSNLLLPFPIYCIFLLFGFSAWVFPLVLLRAERIHILALLVLPPSLWLRRRLENHHKVLKKLLLCKKKITVGADNLFPWCMSHITSGNIRSCCLQRRFPLQKIVEFCHSDAWRGMDCP